jgi:predicted alpha-1,2-mannosidase
MTMTPPDLFHAVDDGGNCLPGPCAPFGLVHLGPDMVNHNTSGYATGEDLRHFSHIHVGGAGGSGRYGCLGIVPLGQRPDWRTVGFAMHDEVAELGRYAVALEQRQGFGELYTPGRIACEISATKHTGIHRYRWTLEQEAWVRFDFGAALGSVSVGGWQRWLDDCTMIGRADYRGGWGHDHQYSVFFWMEFDQAMTEQGAQSTAHPMRSDGSGEGAQLNARARVAEGNELTLRVGVSLVSVAHAQRHLRDEQGGRDFDAIQAVTQQAWHDVLGRYRVSGGTEEDRRMWSTMWQRLYQIPTLLAPEDVPWFAAEQPQVNDLICLWDSVRGANSLLALVEPGHQVQLCNALTEIGEQTGWIPDAWLMGASGQIQGGCSAAVLFAEAVKKKLAGFDLSAAFAALRKSNETPSPDPFLYGRYPHWAQGKNLPTSVINNVSRSLEYAFHDHCTAALSQALGDDTLSAAYLDRGQRPWALWHDELRCFGPQCDDGSWDTFDPWRPSRRDFWSDPHFYEGTAYDYALTCWHYLPEIIQRHGGPAAFIDHLDQFMQQCYHWKEINLHAAWLYHFVGRPDLTTPALRAVADAKVLPGRKGFADNEDFGAWSSWWLGHAMGLGVMPGSDRYLIGVPRFDQVELDLPGAEKPLRIRCVGASHHNGVIAAVTIDGQPHHDNWLRHDAIARGADIVLQLVDPKQGPTDWGREPARWEG